MRHPLCEKYPACCDGIFSLDSQSRPTKDPERSKTLTSTKTRTTEQATVQCTCGCGEARQGRQLALPSRPRRPPRRTGHQLHRQLERRRREQRGPALAPVRHPPAQGVRNERAAPDQGSGQAERDVHRRTIYTLQPTQYETITAAIEELRGSSDHPAQTIVGVTGLALDGLLIEIETTVVLPE